PAPVRCAGACTARTPSRPAPGMPAWPSCRSPKSHDFGYQVRHTRSRSRETSGCTTPSERGFHTMLPPRIDAQVVKEKIGPYADTRATLEERGAIYQELLGFVPPRIEARLAVTGALDPDLLDLQERLRAHAMYPRCFDVKTAQLMLFGMLLMDLSDAALLHALAARRAGASWEELQPT